MHVGEITLGAFGASKSFDDALDVCWGKEELGEGFDICCGSVGHDVRRKCRFDLAFADEEDDRVEEFVWQSEIFGQALSVPVILVQRVLESELVSARKRLGPLGVVFVPEYPAVKILGLHHEDAVGGDEDMVDLGCTVC
jgi:hypothetical protein